MLFNCIRRVLQDQYGRDMDEVGCLILDDGERRRQVQGGKVMRLKSLRLSAAETPAHLFGVEFFAGWDYVNERFLISLTPEARALLPSA